MGWLSGLIDSALSAFSAAVETVSTAIRGVSSVLATAVEAIGRGLSYVLDKVEDWVDRIAATFETVFRVLEVLGRNETLEELGDRAIQAAEAGITPEKFASHDEYMEALRNFEPDPERSKGISTEAKVLTGLSVCTMGLEQRFELSDNTLFRLWPLVVVAPRYFHGERIKTWLERGIDPVGVADCFEGRLRPSEAVSTWERLTEIDRELEPDLTPEQIRERLDEIADKVRGFRR